MAQINRLIELGRLGTARKRFDLLSSDADHDSEGYVGEEAGELQTGLVGSGSLSTGNAGSRQSDDDAQGDRARK